MVSIIVPVYNAESTIRKCIESILKQPYRNWELILINDGSTDASRDILNYYDKKYESICVIHQNNGGVSLARNIGIQKARGEWVTFIDADDYIEGDFFSIVENCSYDLIIQQTYFFSQNEPLNHFQPIPPSTMNSKDEIRSFFSKYMDYHVFLAPWGKIFRKEIIENLKFTTGQIVGEDTLFNQQSMANIQSIMIGDDGAYCYYNVVSHNKYNITVAEALDYLSNIYSAYKAHGHKKDSFLAMELNFYTYVCRKDALHNAQKWYGSKIVKTIFSECKHLYNTPHKLKMIMSRIPGFFYMYHSITGKWV
jgi:glycosyltransferase involved in cell wall biosynthesis